MGIPETFHCKIAFILQTRECHCTQMKAWPFCSVSNPVWALFQLELLPFPGANSSQAACDEKHVFVEAGTKSRTSLTLASLPQKATLLISQSCYVGLWSSVLLLHLTITLLFASHGLNSPRSCLCHMEIWKRVTIVLVFPLIKVLEVSRIQPSSMLHPDVTKQCRNASESLF